MNAFLTWLDGRKTLIISILIQLAAVWDLFTGDIRGMLSLRYGPEAATIVVMVITAVFQILRVVTTGPMKLLK